MQNRFGLKDFILFVLVVVVGVAVWLQMVQNDRTYNTLNQVKQILANQERLQADAQRLGDQQLQQTRDIVAAQQTLAETQQRLLNALREGVRINADAGSDDVDETPGSSLHAWARPGIPVSVQPPWGFARDPRGEQNYRRGGEFVEVFEAQPSKLTPVLGEDVYARRIQDQVCERLAEYDPETLELRGVLAEAWQYDPEGRWLRVKLREHARFDDGKPVTAEDVRYTFHDYIMNTELETESLRSIMYRVQSVEVLSTYVFEFTFSEPDAFNFDTALQMYVLPAHIYGQLTPRQINSATGYVRGSGAFKMERQDINDQWKPGEDVVLVRNEQYWGDAKPALSRLRYRVINEDVARLISFTNKEADMILPTSPAFVEKTSERGWDDKAYSFNWVNMRSSYNFIGWQCGPRNGKLTPFHDKRVRRAMTMLLDRERMIRDIWAGIGVVSTGPSSSASPASNPAIKPWPYDLNQARRLLAEAGWADRNGDGQLENAAGEPFRFEFTYAVGGQIIERIAKYIQDQCASVGIQCDLRGVDWSQYDQILKTRDFDALTMGWSASAPESDPRQIWSTASIQNQGHNFIQWNAGQDELIYNITSQFDREKRMQAWHEFHNLIHEEQPYTFVREVPWLRFISKDFANVHMYPKGLEQREYYIQPSYNRGL